MLPPIDDVNLDIDLGDLGGPVLLLQQEHEDSSTVYGHGLLEGAIAGQFQLELVDNSCP